jgi:hypothetical protein
MAFPPFRGKNHTLNTQKKPDAIFKVLAEEHPFSFLKTLLVNSPNLSRALLIGIEVIIGFVDFILNPFKRLKSVIIV